MRDEITDEKYYTFWDYVKYCTCVFIVSFGVIMLILTRGKI